MTNFVIYIVDQTSDQIHFKSRSTQLLDRRILGQSVQGIGHVLNHAPRPIIACRSANVFFRGDLRILKQRSFGSTPFHILPID